MQESNVLQAAANEPLVDYATTIPTAPTLPASQDSRETIALPVASPRSATRGRVARRIIRLSRLLLIRALRGLVPVGRALWPYRLTLGVSAVLLAIIAWMALLLWMPPPDAPAFTRVASIPPAPAVERFIKGQQTYDGELMWESLSEEAKAQLLSRGDSKATWQARAEMDKRIGQIYRKYDYVGGVKLQHGGIFFYLVDVVSPQPERNGPTSYVFTVDEDGKILSVE